MAVPITYPDITPPVSLNEPTERDIALSKAFVRYVDELKLYEDSTALAKRNNFIDEVESIVIKWVRAEARNSFKKKYTEEDDARFGTRVLPFGGLAFGVATKGSDIDAVCLLPKFVERQKLFESLPDALQADDNISNLRKVTEAYVPIISFQYKGVQIDLCFAILRFQYVPSDVDLHNDAIFQNMDELSMRSLSGVRDVTAVLNLVPNEETFRNTLKVVKTWAKSKYIHSSAMGYPGGIAWTIMVARTCQMYPHAAVGSLVEHVFSTFATWPWPKAVILRELVRSDLGMEQYYASRMRHMMPILTPAYPEHNCAFTVCLSTRDVVSSQMQDACKTCDKIRKGEEEVSALFKPINFFDLYKHFIMIMSKAASAAEHIDWSGFLESQLRKLVVGLENVSEIKRLHLYAKTYSLRCGLQARWFIGMKLQKKDGKTQSFGISPMVRTFKQLVNDLASERNFLSKSTIVDIQHIPKKEISNILSSME